MTASTPAAGVREQPGRPDDGLFGPDSVTWLVMGQPVIWIAALRALYLQALHPRMMRGTWQNTAFAHPGEAWGRFTRTTEFVRIRTYGTLAEVDRAGRRLRKIHSSLTGVDSAGHQFRLDEPELLRWVHCGEVASYADVARRSGVRVSAGELDQFVAEQRRSAAVVGLEPATVPGSMAELGAYYDQVQPQLRACPEAWQALRTSFTPHVPPELLPLRLIVPPLNTLAFASLPRWARRLYGTPGSRLTDVVATAALRAAFESTSRIPPRLFFLPAAAVARRRARARQRAAPA